MAYVFDMNYYDQDGPTLGYTVAAEMMYGDNGPANGPDPELFVGDMSGDGDPERFTWNPVNNADGSWDTGWIPVSVNVSAADSSGVTLSVFGDDADATYSGQAYGDLTDVILVAHVGINASVQWSDVEVNFGLNGHAVDSYSSPGAGPSVDTTNSDTATATAGLEVVPSTTADSALITGKIRFTTPANTYPNPADLKASVLVNA